MSTVDPAVRLQRPARRPDDIPGSTTSGRGALLALHRTRPARQPRSARRTTSRSGPRTRRCVLSPYRSCLPRRRVRETRSSVLEVDETLGAAGFAGVHHEHIAGRSAHDAAADRAVKMSRSSAVTGHDYHVRSPPLSGREDLGRRVADQRDRLGLDPARREELPRLLEQLPLPVSCLARRGDPPHTRFRHHRHRRRPGLPGARNRRCAERAPSRRRAVVANEHPPRRSRLQGAPHLADQVSSPLRAPAARATGCAPNAVVRRRRRRPRGRATCGGDRRVAGLVRVPEPPLARVHLGLGARGGASRAHRRGGRRPRPKPCASRG